MRRKLIPCDICGSLNYRILYVTRDRMFPVNGSFQLVICSNCGLLYLNPQPEAEELQRHYPEESYYAYRSEKEQVNIVDSQKLVRWRTIRNGILKPLGRIFPIFQSEMERELAYLGPVYSGMNVLDVGCGVGDELSFYRDRGASTYGVEIGPKACEEGRNKGHHIFCGQLIEAGFENEFFDLVRFNHSLEHMTSPRSILIETNRILKRRGKVWISVPNHGSMHAKLFGKWFFHMDSPRHLYGFTARTMIHLLTKTRFKTEYIHTHFVPGSLCFSLEYWLNDHFPRLEPFYQGKMKVKSWYIAAEPLFFFPRVVADLFSQGEILTVCGRKP